MTYCPSPSLLRINIAQLCCLLLLFMGVAIPSQAQEASFDGVTLTLPSVYVPLNQTTAAVFYGEFELIENSNPLAFRLVSAYVTDIDPLSDEWHQYLFVNYLYFRLVYDGVEYSIVIAHDLDDLTYWRLMHVNESDQN